MTENNLYMEGDEMRLYVDVQPLFIDVLENSKNAAASSAAAAARCEANATAMKNSIADYKTNLELYYAQAIDGLTNLYNNFVSEFNIVTSNAEGRLQLQKDNILNDIVFIKQSAINSINTNSQNYVMQARNYAEQAQNTVDNRVSIEHLNQSKALETGDVSDDTDVLTWLKYIAHSTFCGYQDSNAISLDPKKFIKMGGSNITSDGIASGFSSGNYIKSLTGTNIRNTQHIIIKGNFKTPSTLEGNPVLYSNDSLNSNGSIFFQISSNTKKLKTEFVNISSLNVETSSDFIFPDTEYDFIFEYNNGSKLKIKEHSQSSYTEFTGGTGVFELNNDWWIGNLSWQSTGVYAAAGYQINLKQFSITVDGVEVFSGNKTGIDTIKPDDYTVVGTPTISADGVASGFSGSNYINTGFKLADLYNKKWTIKTRTVYKYLNNFGTFGVTLMSNYSGTQWMTQGNISVNNSDKNIIFYGQTIGGTEGAKISIPNTETNIKDGDIIDLDLSFDLEKYTLKAVINNSTPITKSWTPTTDDKNLVGTQTSGTIYINSRQGGGSLTDSDCQFDLNAFKIYVDGNLVYQPCLKIPYTESKTGSKITDIMYRGRVNDMYEQYGYAPYYTLSDSDFTLPKGEIYGMIENLKNLIIERTS